MTHAVPAIDPGDFEFRERRFWGGLEPESEYSSEYLHYTGILADPVRRRYVHAHREEALDTVKFLLLFHFDLQVSPSDEGSLFELLDGLSGGFEEIPGFLREEREQETEVDSRLSWLCVPSVNLGMAEDYLLGLNSRLVDIDAIWSSSLEDLGLKLDLEDKPGSWKNLRFVADSLGIGEILKAYYAGVPVEDLVPSP